MYTDITITKSSSTPFRSIRTDDLPVDSSQSGTITTPLSLRHYHILPEPISTCTLPPPPPHLHSGPRCAMPTIKGTCSWTTCIRKDPNVTILNALHCDIPPSLPVIRLGALPRSLQSTALYIPIAQPNAPHLPATTCTTALSTASPLCREARDHSLTVPPTHVTACIPPS